MRAKVRVRVRVWTHSENTSKPLLTLATFQHLCSCDSLHRTILQLTTATQITAPHRIAPYRVAPHRTAPHRIAPHCTIATQDPGFLEFGQHTFPRGCARATEEDGSGAHHQVGSGNIVRMGDTTKYWWLPTLQGGSDSCTDHTASFPCEATPTQDQHKQRQQHNKINQPTNQSSANTTTPLKQTSKQTNKLKQKFMCCACVCLRCAVSVY